MDLENLPRRTQLTIVFVIATIAVSSLAGLDIVNYQLFFPALQQLQVSIPFVQASPDNQSLHGTVIITVANPTTYTGLGLQSLSSNFTVIISNGTLIPQGVIPFTIRSSPLAPSSSVNVTLPLVGSGTGPQVITRLIKDGKGISFGFTVDLFLTTFLDGVVGISALYQCTNGTTVCEQQGIIIIPRGTGGPARGG